MINPMIEKIKAAGHQITKNTKKYGLSALPAAGALGGMAASNILGVDDDYRADATEDMENLMNKEVADKAADEQIKTHGIPDYVKATNSHDNDWLFKDTDKMREMQDKSKVFGDNYAPEQSFYDKRYSPNEQAQTEKENSSNLFKEKPLLNFDNDKILPDLPTVDYDKNGNPTYQDKILDPHKYKNVTYRDDHKLTMPDKTELKLNTEFNDVDNTMNNLKANYSQKIMNDPMLKEKYANHFLSSKPFVDRAQEIGTDYRDAQKDATRNYGVAGAALGLGANYAARKYNKSKSR